MIFTWKFAKAIGRKSSNLSAFAIFRIRTTILELRFGMIQFCKESIVLNSHKVRNNFINEIIVKVIIVGGI